MALMSDNLKDAICQQIGHEVHNANLYLYICGFLKNKGLDNLAKHFEGQHAEETAHAKEFFNLLTDLNTDIIIPKIDEMNMPLDNIKTIAKIYLDREILTTKSIDEIKNMALQENCPVVEEKMREMISKQQHEYEEATTFVDKAELTEGDWKFVLLWDASLG